MALVAGAALAVVAVLAFMMWGRWRATAGVDEGGGKGVDVLIVTAPRAAEVRQESVPAVRELAPPLQEARVPAATIVEMPSREGEKPEASVSRAGMASARPAETRPASAGVRVGDARASRAATLSRAAAKPQGKRGGDSRADARHSPPQVRRQSVVSKDVEERIDSDVQVIEAIVTRSR